MAAGKHTRQHSMRVTMEQEATTLKELNEFAEFQCHATRLFASSLKRPAKKWLRLRDYTFYWCKSQQETQAEGCIRFLYDDVVLERVDDTQIKFKCRDKDRMFDFESKLDATRWFDRISKTVSIRDCNGTNFSEDGKSVFKNTCNMFLLNQQQWVAVGQGNLQLLVDTKQSGGIPDVAAIMTITAEDVNKSYEFLLTPYIKPKGNKTWILPKCMDMNTDFNQQTLAFRFPSENDAQIFHNVFDSTYRSTDVEAKRDIGGRVDELEEENKTLREENENLKMRCERLREKKDDLKRLLDKARTEGPSQSPMAREPYTPLEPDSGVFSGGAGPRSLADADISQSQIASFFESAVEMIASEMRDELMSDQGRDKEQEIRDLRRRLADYERSGQVPQAKQNEEIDKIKKDTKSKIAETQMRSFERIQQISEQLKQEADSAVELKATNRRLRDQLANKIKRLVDLETQVFQLQRSQ